ncbi:TonB-dependent receptor [Acidicapsa ligni]|uniref:TonB-dependent receptor n=1 Tax=Acidicapsa ligni TaxID=542300 RepID=UPI0021E03AD6|nr:Plug and carboxypeptidase regulatory-like domain-containing protein [Acidicapsa ligni]
MRFKSALFALLIASIFCCQLPLLAQVNGSITGTVRDSSDAVVPRAKVVVSNSEHGIRRETITNAAGDYLVQALGEGTYVVTVTAPNFEKYVASNIVIRVGQNARIDAKLVVGSQTEEVSVEGSSAGTIETQSSELSTTITAKQITQLELNGRSFVQLVELSPGVSNQTGQSEGQTGPGGSVSYSINGGRTEYNNWEVDGGDVMDSGSMSNLNVFPNVDALDQVQVFTSSYDAQYGRSGSGAIEAVTKSGTNHLHGEVFEFLRNQFFNAANYFNPAGEPIQAYKKHDFGGTIGGPVYIPHVYNGHDKTFFFYSEELRRENVPGFYNTPIPTAAERAGDYNGTLCPTAGTPFIRTPTLYPDCPAYSTDPATGNLVGFPGNNVAPYIDTTNANIFLNLIPLPNTTFNGLPYFQMAAGAPYTSHEELFKIDHQINSKLHASFRYIHDSTDQVYLTSTPWAISNLPGIPGHELGPGISMVFNLNWTPSNTLTNEFMVGYGANHLSITNTTNAGNLPPGLTMTGLFNNNFGGKIPSFSIGGGESFGSLVQDAGPVPFYNSNPTYTYRDTVTKLLHSHNLKFGFYFTANQKNEDAELNTQGILSFNGNGGSFYTAPQTNGGPPSTGNSFADFLVGDIANYTQSNQEPKYHFKFKIFEPFIQDDWHVNKKLTLNLGLRMSLFGLYTEKNNLAYNFDPSAFNPANMPTVDPDNGNLDFGPGQSINNLSGIVQCGVGTVPKGCMKGHLFNPAPRVGFAYDPFGNGKTAIRAAYGIFYEHTNGNEANAESLENQPPLVQTPIQFYIQGYKNIGGGGEYFPLEVNSIPTDKVRWPYMQQYHLDIQREILKDTIVTVSYVGSKGTHLTLQNDLNQLHDLNQATNPYPAGIPITNQDCGMAANGGPVYNSAGNLVAGDALLHLNVACGNVNVDQYRQNFPGWDTITGIGQGASSNYNALQVSGRRTAANLELTLAYTYSHAIDNASDRYDGNFVDTYNLKANRASSNLDQRQILNFSYIYTLPLLQQYNRATRLILGGWQWSGITSFQTGKPFSIVNGYYYDNAGVANGNGTGSYVDFAPGVSKHHVTGPKRQAGVYGPLLFNPAAYNEPTGLTFGNSGRNSLFGPKTTNFDMGVFKHFAIGKKVTTEFRAEAFNVFNHAQFTGVNNSPGCFGQNGNNANSAGNTECVNGEPDQGIVASNFLHPSAAYAPRILQFALKVIF